MKNDDGPDANMTIEDDSMVPGPTVIEGIDREDVDNGGDGEIEKEVADDIQENAVGITPVVAQDNAVVITPIVEAAEGTAPMEKSDDKAYPETDSSPNNSPNYPFAQSLPPPTTSPTTPITDISGGNTALPGPSPPSSTALSAEITGVNGNMLALHSPRTPVMPGFLFPDINPYSTDFTTNNWSFTRPSATSAGTTNNWSGFTGHLATSAGPATTSSNVSTDLFFANTDFNPSRLSFSQGSQGF